MAEKRDSVGLIMLDRHLGNFLVASPVLQYLAGRFERATVVLHRPHVDLAKRIPGFPDPLPVSSPRDGLWPRVRLFHHLLRVITRAKHHTVIDFGGNKTAALAGGLSRAPLRICHQAAPYARLYNRHADREALGPHRLDTYGALAAAAGHRSGWLPPRLRPTEEDQRGLAEHCPDTPERIVCLHVAGGKHYKHWPLERYARIIDWLASQGLQPALIGATPDRSAADRVKELCRHQPLDLVAQCPIGPLIALLSQCRLFLGNDSGPMHIAAAAGSPIVALFGPTDPVRWGPLTERAIIVRGSSPVAAGGGKKAFHDGRTMDSISPEAVMDAISRQLAA